MKKYEDPNTRQLNGTPICPTALPSISVGLDIRGFSLRNQNQGRRRKAFCRTDETQWEVGTTIQANAPEKKSPQTNHMKK